ncbi:MAG: hypothetical protein GY750_04220 [Lentisphaerae bacterium]|nr:hypothetical protein [Lentisphaerota bacterium]MCP4100617.1 hypothetical protein [Lentisphaerota bacterium]
MIFFAADDHYGSNPGKAIYDNIKSDYDILFKENDWSIFTDHDLPEKCSLLVLNMIADASVMEMPGPDAEKYVKEYCEKGGNLLLLHGSSAAFWHWNWWRPIVGLRWIRGTDPDGFAASTHPYAPCTIKVCKTRHPLAAQLKKINLPEDEIYTSMEQTCPVSVVMDTTFELGTFPQCYETATPWGGKIVGFIPGHSPAATSNPELIYNIKTIINYLAA